LSINGCVHKTIDSRRYLYISIERERERDEWQRVALVESYEYERDRLRQRFSPHHHARVHCTNGISQKALFECNNAKTVQLLKQAEDRMSSWKHDSV
jgi:hypothetical protein